MEKVSVLVLTRNRPVELMQTIENLEVQRYNGEIEIIVVENGSDTEVLSTNRTRLGQRVGIRYVELDSNRGVAGGRNVALKLSDGDFVIEIDDDAVFEEDDAIAKAAAYMRSHSRVGIVAFRITNFFSREIVSSEYPFRDKRRDPKRPGECTWFIGAGHCFRRGLLDKIGYYRDFFPWGSEEQDYSLRAMEAGYDIMYFPAINVLHKKTLTARMANQRTFGALALKNRTKFALLNLPYVNAATHFVVRGVQASVRYRDPVIPLKALGYLWRERSYIRDNRAVVSKATRRKIASLRGQLYY